MLQTTIIVMSQATTILDFWFGHPNDPNYGKIQPFWFDKQPDFDTKVRNLFLEDYQKAVAGYLHDWRNSPETCLALILLLDQFPRNMFRDTPQAFATDWEALSLAQQAINKGYDRQLLAVQRWFISDRRTNTYRLAARSYRGHHSCRQRGRCGSKQFLGAYQYTCA